MRVAHFLFKLQLGGIEEMIKNLTIRMNELEYLSSVYSLSMDECAEVKTKYIDKFKENNIDFTCFQKKEGKQRLKTILLIRREIRTKRPDIIFIHNERLTPFVVTAALGMKIPKIQVIHNERTNADIAHNMLLKHFINRYVAVSYKAKENMVKKFSLNNKKAVLINNGIYTDEFDCIKKNYKRIKSIYNIGRLTAQKNQLELIDIYKLYYEKCLDNDIKPASLYIVGKGDLEQVLQNKINDSGFGDYIFLVGSTSDVIKVYDDCDVFLLPSRWEGLPLVIMEAASSGIPCICYDVGGINEIIENKISGILINAGDVSNYAKELYALTVDEEKREKIGMCAKKRCVEIFSIKACSEKYDKLIRGVV